MKTDEKEYFESRAEVFKAMGHSTRLYILTTLLKGERCVCELTELVGSDMSTVSKHLQVLKNAGLIGSYKEGKKVIYVLKCTCIGSFFECIENVIQQKHTTQRKQITLQRQATNG
jgi:ArsR family transcriptional regulator